MTITVTAGKRHATLPNCDKCGRFTSGPEVRSWCEGGNNGFHMCFELLLCPTCATKNPDDRATEPRP